MKKVKVLILSIFSIIALLALVLYLKAKLYTDIQIKEDTSLIKKIELQVGNSTYLDLNTITDFQWDKVHIVTPYSQLKTVFEKNNIKPVNINGSIETNDGINLILFTLNNNIVAYVNLPRKIADFPSLESKIFDKSKAKFNLTKDKNEVKLIPNKQ